VILHSNLYGPRSADPVLAIHGLTCAGTHFRRLAEEGLPWRRFIAVDLRGHGKSSWDPPWDVGQHVEDVLETLDAVGVERSDVIGFSYGGRISVHLAAVAPERVDRLVLLDPGLVLDRDFVLESVEEELADWSFESPEAALAERMLDRPPASPRGGREDNAIRLERGEDGRYRIPYSRGAAITAYSEMSRPLPSLSSFPGQVLLVTGARSHVVGPSPRSWIEREVGVRLSLRSWTAATCSTGRRSRTWFAWFATSSQRQADDDPESISASTRTTFRRASGYIVRKSMMSAQSWPFRSR
jgi:lipase